jgi:iron complex outermembrane receptor protein
MDMGSDRYSYGTGVPMETEANTDGAMVQGEIMLSERDFIRLGAEYQFYTLYD